MSKKIKPEDLTVFKTKDTPLTTEQMLHIMQRTPEKYTYERPAKGGGKWTYVQGGYVKKVLNYITAYNWDFTIQDEEEKHGQIVVHGRLTIRTQGGQEIVKEQYGRAEIKYRKGTDEALDYGNDKKAAATDALKKCASELGIASDIYNANEFVDIEVENHNPEPPKKLEMKDIKNKSNKIKERMKNENNS